MQKTIAQEISGKRSVERTPDAISLVVNTPGGSRSCLEPIRQGIPFASGILQGDTMVRVVDNLGCVIPSQTKVLARWADDSVQWLLVDFLHRLKDVHPDENKSSDNEYFIKIDEQAEISNATISPGSSWGKTEIGSPDPQDSNVFLQLGEQWRGSIAVRLIDGRKLQFSPSHCRNLETGNIREVVELQGSMHDQSMRVVLNARFEIHLICETRLARLSVTLGNPAAAKHPGGIWELGDSKSIEIAEAAIVFSPMDSEIALGKSPQVVWNVDGLTRLRKSGLPWNLYQDSSGGEAWNSSNHVDKTGRVPLKFRGYKVSCDHKTIEGDRATPFVELTGAGSVALGISINNFWQNFPKSISASTNEFRIGLFPEESDRPHELQPGEQKTHQFWVGGNAEALTGNPVANPAMSMHRPSVVSLDPQTIADSGVIPWLTPKSSDPNSNYLSLVDAAIEGDDTFFQKRETIDEYGWRNFGDMYGDHEAAFHDTPLISHYNNQYDIVLGYGIQFLRSGDRRWLELMRDQAWHVVDIDIYHAETDKAAYCGGQFWHTFHYIDADKATHRSYPTGTCGGGPASEQGYARGLGLYYFLTGERLMLETVDRMGEWIIAADDCRRTPFRWLSRQGTGVTSASGTLDYQGPGRGAGNAIELSVAAFEVTGRKEFLKEAEKLIRRVIHPHDDIESLDLLDAERRWYYNLFLQSLGRYLWIKHQLGQHDEMYGYGRACLLHYAQWMIDNEYPYLEKPEILEYPTETWAAQDMRKCEVFQWASLHADGELRLRLVERANYFFDYSTTTLSKMDTRTLCRPVALMLSNGYSRAGFESQRTNLAGLPTLPPAVGDGDHDFGQPRKFIPQKIQAIRRAKVIAAAGCAVTIAAAILGLTVWLQ